jgi:hypothetical protein
MGPVKSVKDVDVFTLLLVAVLDRVGGQVDQALLDSPHVAPDLRIIVLSIFHLLELAKLLLLVSEEAVSLTVLVYCLWSILSLQS